MKVSREYFSTRVPLRVRCYRRDIQDQWYQEYVRNLQIHLVDLIHLLVCKYIGTVVNAGKVYVTPGSTDKVELGTRVHQLLLLCYGTDSSININTNNSCTGINNSAVIKFWLINAEIHTVDFSMLLFG